MEITNVIFPRPCLTVNFIRWDEFIFAWNMCGTKNLLNQVPSLFAPSLKHVLVFSTYGGEIF